LDRNNKGENVSEPVIIKQILAGPYQVFTYIVACSQTLEGVVIDPAGDEDKLLAFIQSKKIQIFNVPICMHEADHRFFSDALVQEETSKELGLPPPDPVDKKLKDGDVLEVGNLNLEVIHTPGHTPGSACYLIDGNLFTGDTLFVGAAGRTDLIGGSLQTLIESLEKRLIVLP
jgi:glyoxylase-like metal-dependent hydrolase (beta-lactamase superfamily II)